MATVKLISPERKKILLEIAQERVEEIIESWFHEIGSWDGLLEDEVLTNDEFDWIVDNVIVLPVSVEEA